MSSLILYGLIAGLFSLVGGLLVIWRADLVRKFITPLLAFSAGAFLGVSFLDLLPEAVEMVAEPHNIFIAALVGFLIFFSLERFIMRYFHSHHTHHAHGEHGHPSEHTRSLPILIIIGDGIHNFLDGVVIALAFIATPLLGLSTALAIAAHEIPQEIGDFTILLDRGWSKIRIIWVNALVSLLSVLGVIVGYFAVSLFEGWIAYLLAGAAGIFIYISASDLIPEIHHRARNVNLYGVLASLLAGVILVGYLVSITH